MYVLVILFALATLFAIRLRKFEFSCILCYSLQTIAKKLFFNRSTPSGALQSSPLIICFSARSKIKIDKLILQKERYGPDNYK